MSDWIKTAKVGDKVVCVNDGKLDSVLTRAVWGAEEAIFEGRIYTIADIFVDDEGYVIFDLVEVKRNAETVSWYYPKRVGYAATRFRPVTPRKTDITVFTDMLKPVVKPVQEDA